mmetsp:Transcript_1162/g.3560  ORF Transcript_1162/g.3560 Transcript_1162/m.3560 type:complete len:115 (+) Transcript_1162:306-650(+)
MPACSISSPWVPVSTMAPLAATRIWSQSLTTDGRCATVMKVRPARAASNACCSKRSSSGSKALATSSNKRIGGSRISALAMATRRLWPADNFDPRGPTGREPETSTCAMRLHCL